MPKFRKKPVVIVEAAEIDIENIEAAVSRGENEFANGSRYANRTEAIAHAVFAVLTTTPSKPSVEAAEIADLKAQNSLLTKGAGIQAGCAKVNAQASKTEIERLKTELVEIRRQTFNDAIANVRDKWLTVSMGKVRIENQSEYERTKVIAELEAARDAAPIPSENDSGIEAKG